MRSAHTNRHDRRPAFAAPRSDRKRTSGMWSGSAALVLILAMRCALQCPFATACATTCQQLAWELPPVECVVDPSLPADRREQASIQAAVQSFLHLASTATDRSQKARNLLNAANWLLSYRAAPEATKLLLNIATTTQRETLRSTSAEAQDLLSQAEALLAEDSPGAQPQAGVAELKRARMTLDAFAQAMAAASADPLDPDDSRRASASLGVLLESESPVINRAARLWVLRLTTASKDAKELALPGPADPPGSPYALLLPLQKCRILAEGGSYSAALATLLLLEERHAAGINDLEAAQRRAMVRLTELNVLKHWGNTLTSPERAEELQWCRDRFDAIRKGDEGDLPDWNIRAFPPVPLIVDPRAAASSPGAP